MVLFTGVCIMLVQPLISFISELCHTMYMCMTSFYALVLTSKETSHSQRAVSVSFSP